MSIGNRVHRNPITRKEDSPMKTLNLMQKIVNITTIALVVLLVLQVALLFMPFFEDRVPKKTYFIPDPQPTDYSMMDYAFFKTEEMEYFFKPETKAVFGDKKYLPNNYCMGIVYVFALGMVALVSNIVSRKAFFTHIVSVLWAIMALPAFFGPIMTLANTVQWIRWAGFALSVVGALLVFGRLYPWFAGRFMKKKYIEKEKAAQA